jgi:hypothetical protein
VLRLPSDTPAELRDKQSALNELLGYVVVSEYPLMPSGQIIIEHRSYNAMAEAGYIDAGWRVEVVAVRQRDLIVRATNKPLTPTRPRSQADDSNALPGAEFVSKPNLLDIPANELGLDSIDE